jgi:hypothetical protein
MKSLIKRKHEFVVIKNKDILEIIAKNYSYSSADELLKNHKVEDIIGWHFHFHFWPRNITQEEDAILREAIANDLKRDDIILHIQYKKLFPIKVWEYLTMGFLA